jgi:drug/metabolite transporter (DMT)-like permease
LSYTQLVYAALFDLFVFGAIPDQWTLAGSAIILTAGALLWRAASRA